MSNYPSWIYVFSRQWIQNDSIKKLQPPQEMFGLHHIFPSRWILLRYGIFLSRKNAKRRAKGYGSFFYWWWIARVKFNINTKHFRLDEMKRLEMSFHGEMIFIHLTISSGSKEAPWENDPIIQQLHGKFIKVHDWWINPIFCDTIFTVECRDKFFYCSFTVRSKGKFSSFWIIQFHLSCIFCVSVDRKKFYIKRKFPT